MLFYSMYDSSTAIGFHMYFKKWLLKFKRSPLTITLKHLVQQGAWSVLKCILLLMQLFIYLNKSCIKHQYTVRFVNQYFH